MGQRCPRAQNPYQDSGPRFLRPISVPRFWTKILDQDFYGQSPYQDSGPRFWTKIFTANLRTKILDFRGFGSRRILIPRVGILMFTGDFPESLSQRILAGIILVGLLGVCRMYTYCMRICNYMNTIYIYIYMYIPCDPKLLFLRVALKIRVATLIWHSSKIVKLHMQQ